MALQGIAVYTAGYNGNVSFKNFRSDFVLNRAQLQTLLTDNHIHKIPPIVARVTTLECLFLEGNPVIRLILSQPFRR